MLVYLAPKQQKANLKEAGNTLKQLEEEELEPRQLVARDLELTNQLKQLLSLLRTSNIVPQLTVLQDHCHH